MIVLSISRSSRGAEPAPLTAYSEGLAQLASGKFAEAAAVLSRAHDAAPDDRRFTLAHAVAEGLGENYADAVAELSRIPPPATGRNREPELWTYVFETMGGFATPMHRIGGARPGEANNRLLQNEAVSMPAHMVQGGDDYPADFASFIYYEMALNAYGRPRQSQQRPDPSLTGPLRLKAGRWFAARFQASPDLAAAHLQRAKELNNEHKFSESLRELQYARIPYPEDPALAFYAGDNWLGLGHPASARRELTYALTLQSGWTAGYLDRALAAARLGDTNRVEADLVVAAELDARETGRWRPQITQALSKAAVTGDPATLLAELEQASRKAGTAQFPPQLVAQAQAFHRAAGARRKRHDEVYQDRVRTLEAAIKVKPQSADAKVELAAYLLRESRSERRSEAVEPRRAPEPYRQRPNEQRDLKRTVELCDAALQIDRRHVRARIEKALALSRLGQDRESETLVDEALALAPRNPEALRLRARYWTERANNLSLQAAALRAPRSASNTHTENRSDGVYEVTVTTYYSPSNADLARANSLDEAAASLYLRAENAIAAALEANKGTLEGDLLLAESQFAHGESSAAESTLKKILAAHSQSREAHEALADLYTKTGRPDLADLERSAAAEQFQTTAGWLLKQAWKKIAAQDFAPARQLLYRARQLDPQDARVPSYLGVIERAGGREEEARAQFRFALLLEEGRLAQNEPAVSLGEAPEHEAQDFGLALKLRLLLSETAVSGEAVQLLLRNTSTARLLGPGGRAAQMFSAMLPEPGAPPIPAPAPVNMATLLADSHVAAGKALQKLGRADEAQAQFAAAIQYGPTAGVPNIGGRAGSNFAGNAAGNTAEAYLELAKQAIRSKDYRAAMNYMSQAANLRIPRERLQEANQIQMEIARGLNGQ